MKKVSIITGASRGIGAEIALALAARGWTIVLNYRSHEKAAHDVAERLQKLGNDCLSIRADISRQIDRHKLVDQCLKRFGQINLLVNNAGIAPVKRLDILETSEKSYDDVMSINLKGPFFLTQLVANRMIDSIKSGKIENPKIINMGSISAYTSSPNRSDYCLSKAGMGMMTALFADRLAEFGIGVFEIRPGIIETDMTRGVKQKYDRLIAGGLTPIRRWGKPEDVAKAVIAIAEESFPFSTGEIINVDGGFHLQRL